MGRRSIYMPALCMKEQPGAHGSHLWAGSMDGSEASRDQTAYAAVYKLSVSLGQAGGSCDVR